MTEKALWSLIGGVGGGLSLALLSLLTKTFNLQGDYLLAVAFSIGVFAPAGLCVIGSIILAVPGTRITMNWALLAILVSACTAGALFPWGTFGFWLAFFPLIVIFPITLHGFSILALKGFLGAMTGLIVGGIAATLCSMTFSHLEPFSGSEFITAWIAFRLISYGITLGLVLKSEKFLSSQ